jgi:hypothetical protein
MLGQLLAGVGCRRPCPRRSPRLLTFFFWLDTTIAPSVVGARESFARLGRRTRRLSKQVFDPFAKTGCLYCHFLWLWQKEGEGGDCASLATFCVCHLLCIIATPAFGACALIGQGYHLSAIVVGWRDGKSIQSQEERMPEGRKEQQMGSVPICPS